MKSANKSQMWQAVLKRDPRFDGQFFYAVKTTRVFCRPTCPSRRPKLENVEFFLDTQGAQKAGYRSCSRCKPLSELDGKGQLAREVCSFIRSNLDRSLTLAFLSKNVGISPFHLQRTFKEVMKMTPRQYADACRVNMLKEQLVNGRSVTEALHEAGYSSSSRLYESSAKNLGMTPATYGKKGRGATINYAVVKSPLGLVLIAGTKNGLCFLQFGTSTGKLVELLNEEFSQAHIKEDSAAIAPWIDELIKYCNGVIPNLKLPLDIDATDFQQQVWHQLRNIPAGTTQTYGAIARSLGRPKSCRAVGRACASNRIALAIPCHRVITGTGNLGGYRWGVSLKKRLLAQEGNSGTTAG